MERIIYLGVEDDLSEAVARRTLESINPDLVVGTVYGRRGFGDLKRNISGWNRLAKIFPFLLLTDLDEFPCPPALIDDWHSGPMNSSLIFRVAVREVEAWLLADRNGLAEFLGVSKDIIPTDPEGLPDPKSALVQIAKKSRRRAVRDRIAPARGSTAVVGPDYNGCLGEFVKEKWDIAAAAGRSNSFNRALTRLKLI